MGRLYYENKNFSGGSFENKPIKAVYYGAELLWPPMPIITLFPDIINFIPGGESIDVEVTITKTNNKAYSIINLPNWLMVSNKTETGFKLTAIPNTSPFTEPFRTAGLTVKLDDYPSQAELTLSQPRIIPLLEIDIDTALTGSLTYQFISTPNTSVDWGDGSPVSTPKPIGQYHVHTYAQAGKYTIKFSEITDIPTQMFFVSSGQGYITGIRQNDGGTSIGDNAFRNQQYIENVILSKNLVSIGISVFDNSSFLTGDFVFSKLNSIGHNAFNNTRIKSVVLENTCTITNLEYYSFSNNATMAKFIICESVKSIGDNVFINNSNLKELHVPVTVTSIGASAFGSCYSLDIDFEFYLLTFIGQFSFNCAFRTLKIHSFGATSLTPVVINPNFVGLSVPGNKIFFGSKDSGNSVDISTIGVNFLAYNNGSTSEWWYYGYTFPEVNGNRFLDGMSANFKIYMRQEVIDIYYQNPTSHHTSWQMMFNQGRVIAI